MFCSATVSSPTWSPTGTHLAYVANFPDASHLFVADVATGKSTQLTRTPLLATLTIDGRVVPLSADRVVLGRSRECDIQIEDGNVSRRHAELDRDGDSGWTVVDLGSTNGTEVNGRRITKRTTLDAGDRIGIGGTELVFGRSHT